MNEVVEVGQAIVTPAEADKVLQMIKAFDYFKSQVLTPRDFVDIQGKPFVKKSGWSKYALACNVSTEVRDERVEERNGARIYHFTYRAIHLPSGRYAEAVASASENEKAKWNHPEHDVRTLAQTRAFNRAISNLVGGGEVSAEEMVTNHGSPTKGTNPRTVPDHGRRGSQSSPSPKPRRKVESTPAHFVLDQEAILNILMDAGLDTTIVNVYPYGSKLYVDPHEGMDDQWQHYDKALAAHGAKWIRLGKLGRWEIPLGG